MRKLITLMLAAIAAAAFTACDSDGNKSYEPNPDAPNHSAGAYFLYQGNYYSNVPGALNSLDYHTDRMAENIYQKANGESLGDTPQCGVCYGSKLYLGIYESNCILVVDKYTNRKISRISLTGAKNGTQPRSMVAHGGKVYVAMYDGYVARLDTVSNVIDAAVKVGPNPEIMCLYNNKLYVPNSDGMNYPNYGTTASIVDLDNFKVAATLEVPLNPYQFAANNTGLYLLAKGNYSDVKACIYKVEDLQCIPVAEATIMATDDTDIYYINDPFYGEQPAEYKIYNPVRNMSREWKIEKVDYPNNIAIDRLGGRIFISSNNMDGKYPSFTTPGYVNEYNIKSAFIKKHAAGTGPAMIFFDKY